MRACERESSCGFVLVGLIFLACLVFSSSSFSSSDSTAGAMYVFLPLSLSLPMLWLVREKVARSAISPFVGSVFGNRVLRFANVLIVRVVAPISVDFDISVSRDFCRFMPSVLMMRSSFGFWAGWS